MLLLEQDITKNGWVDKTTSRLEFGSDDNGKKYKFEVIHDSAVYVRESESHLPGFYYLVSWKGYSKEKNTQKPTSAILHLHKLISTFYHDHSEKPIATFPPINFAPSMVRLTVKPKTEVLSTKQNEANRPRPIALASALKRAKLPVFYLVFGPVSIVGKRSSQLRDSPLHSATLGLAVWFFDFSALLNFHPFFGFSF